MCVFWMDRDHFIIFVYCLVCDHFGKMGLIYLSHKSWGVRVLLAIDIRDLCRRELPFQPAKSDPLNTNRPPPCNLAHPLNP